MNTKQRNHTKSGPGRTHGQCKLIFAPDGKFLGVRKAKRRYGGAPVVRA